MIHKSEFVSCAETNCASFETSFMKYTILQEKFKYTMIYSIYSLDCFYRILHCSSIIIQQWKHASFIINQDYSTSFDANGKSGILGKLRKIVFRLLKVKTREISNNQ